MPDETAIEEPANTELTYQLQNEIRALIGARGVRVASRMLGITANNRLGAFTVPKLYKLLHSRAPKVADLAHRLLIARGYPQAVVRAVAAGGNVTALDDFKRQSLEWRTRQRAAPPRTANPFLVHAALQLLIVDFPNLALVNALHRNADLDEVQAVAMSAMLAGFSDLGYFASANVLARQLSPSSKSMPIHRLGRLRLCEEFVASAVADEVPDLDDGFGELGRDVTSLFECADETKWQTPILLELVNDVRACVAAGGVALYNLLEKGLYSCDDELCDIKEPQLVSAGAGVAAARLCLALFSASRTIVNAGRENIPLPLYELASKLGELCHFIYRDRMCAMADALRALPPEQDRVANTLMSDSFRLHANYYSSRLAHSDGVWFLYPTEEEAPGLGSWAFLGKRGSMIQSLESGQQGLQAGEISHRFVEPDEDGTLPESVDEAWDSGKFILI